MLTLKIINAGPPGLSASDDTAKPDVHWDKGKLFFTHMRVKMVTGGLEQMLKQSVVDKTDLTNFYDFSAVWDAQIQRQLQNETTATAAIKKILNGWGLGLQPDNDRVGVLVVKNAT